MNAVIYARYSSHNQSEQSIEGQLRDCHEYAKRYDLNIVGEYIDRAISGTNDDRPDFQRMIADSAKKQFARVLVWKLDRFSRNRYDSAIYKHKLRQHGVRVISVMENVGDGDESILLEALLEASAEYYSLDLKKKIKRGQRETTAKGKFCGGPVPYGYKSQDGKLVIDEKTAPTIRYVFEQYAQGAPMRNIITDLRKRGVRSSRGTMLNYNTFSRALTNTVYVGQYKYNGEVVPGLSQPMIDQATFDKVQELVKIKAHAPAANKAEVDYLLSGKVFCGLCGSHMVGECGKSANREMYYYYSCASRKKFHSCLKKNEKKDFLEWFVLDQTLSFVLSSSGIRKIAKIIIAQYDHAFSASKINECEKSIRRMENDLNKLIDALIDAPKSAHPRIYERMEALEAQKSAMENDLTKLRIASEIRFSEDEVRAWLKHFCSGDPADEEFRHDIIDTFVNCIYVYDDRIIIFYNIKGCKSEFVTHESLQAANPPTGSPCSDFISNGGALEIKSERAMYVFVNGVFGCIFHRSDGKHHDP